jgi:hypothetical protein
MIGDHIMLMGGLGLLTVAIAAAVFALVWRVVK